MNLRLLAVLALLISLFVADPSIFAQDDDAPNKLAHDIYKQLIEINTTDSVGSTTVAAEVMAQRLRDAGYPAGDVQVLGPNPRKGNLVARLRGTGARKPVLMICHLDVVEARREDWSMDPFQFIEKDGYFYGRGSGDIKDGDAILMAAMIRLKQENFQPDRDIILALTADEEGGRFNGVDWLLKNHRDLVDAEYVINPDAGGVYTDNGRPVDIELEVTEKLYASFQLRATNPGGHSSLPVPDNAIYHIADALAKLQHSVFPFELNAVTRGYFEQLAGAETKENAADMRAILQTPPDVSAIARLSRDAQFNADMRTTCVPTMLQAGHADNALPQTAQAVVNCRILPGHSAEEVRLGLIRVLADPKITVRYISDAGDIEDTAPSQPSGAPVSLKPE